MSAKLPCDKAATLASPASFQWVIVGKLQILSERHLSNWGCAHGMTMSIHS